jgi:hypothetical protein
MTLSAADALIERHMGWRDPAYTFREAFKVEPLEWQIPYLWDTRNIVVVKGRQVGASTSAASTAIRYVRHFPNFLAAIVSPSLKQSAEVKLRAKEGLVNLGEALLQDSSTTLGLDNGSRILSLPGSAKAVRGWSAGLLIIDEAAYLDPDTFLAVRATVAATGGRVIVQSTPASPFGHFYDLFQAVDDGWGKYQVSSEDVSTISEDFLAGERAKLSDDDYAQEYLGQFSAPGLGLVDPDKLRDLTLKDEPVDAGPWGRMRNA